MNLGRLDRSKNSKFGYYLRNYLSLLLPTALHRHLLKVAPVTEANADIIADRVRYYHRFERGFALPPHAQDLSQFLCHPRKTYFFDLYEYVRLFPQAKFCYLFGDVRHVPTVPSFVKSRPLSRNNHTSILLNLDKIRHFIKVEDTLSFAQKKDQIIWRGGAHQSHRIRFFEKHFTNPLCDLGQTNTDKNTQWIRERMTIRQQLQYKFILSLEGNDVASNLKWAMSSNSLVVMPQPKFETWFMEGRLQPGVHYALIKDDYSDLDFQLNYYLTHPQAAEQIIANAHQFVAQFSDPALENTIAIAVVNRYLSLSHQQPWVPEELASGFPMLP